MKNNKKTLFEGFYGFQNAGDDAFVEVSSWGANTYWNSTNNVFLGDIMPKTIATINNKQWFPKIKGFDRLDLLAHLRTTDYFVSAGGSTFSNMPLHNNKSIARMFKRIKPNLATGAIGVSIGPFKNVKDEKNVTKNLKSLDFLSVRDSRSFDFVSSLSLPYNPINAFDLAALLPEVFKENQYKSDGDKGVKKIIGVSICNYESYTNGNLKQEERRNAYFKNLVDALIKHTEGILKVFIINGNSATGDLAVSKQLIKDVPEDRIIWVPYLANVKKTWDEIESCDVMISTRLHASVFACYAKVPFFLIEYHKKCTDFLEDVGQNEIYKIGDAEQPIGAVVNCVKDILSEKYIAPKSLIETVERSKLNFSSTIPLL